MTLSVGKILGIGAGYKAGAIDKTKALQKSNFIQTSVNAGQAFNLNHPAIANSTPYGTSPRANRLDLLA